MIKLYDFLVFSSVISYLLPFILSIKKIIFGIRNDELRILFLISIVSFLSEVCSFSFIYFLKLSNNSIVQVYTLIMIGLIYRYYRKKVLLAFKNIHGYILVVMLVYMLFFFFYDCGFNKMNVFANIFLTLYTILLASIYFYKVYTEMKITNLFQDGLFWINSAFLIYFSSTFYVSLFEEYIRSENSDLLYYTWPIQLVSTMIFNVILSRGIWLMKKQ
ncbi:MAG: hypothetical protein RI922_1475 [Bacteroidota bacterium]|jgi:hypothetical protein